MKSYRSTSAGTVRINSGIGNASKGFVDIVPRVGIKAAIAAIVAVSAAARNQLLFAVRKMLIPSNQLLKMSWMYATNLSKTNLPILRQF
jgi:hypothetical protein